ncbi:hypothetical protein MMC24_003826 [Lignoscripta atroalba]|nr:hypothetical protein [Lignoscripta atroalba]
MAPDRSKGRNVSIFAANDPTRTVLGGLVLTNGVTNQNFYSMIEILLVFQSAFFLQGEGGVVIERNNDPLQPGNYYVSSTGTFSVNNNEPPLTRTISRDDGTRHESFRNAVRARDDRCPVTGQEVLDDDWSGFQATQIFPLAYENHWNEQSYNRWISSVPPSTGGSINSVQNGLLLRSDMHGRFDNYSFSINPDDDYKIVCFLRDASNIAGKHLDRHFLDKPDRPVDQLLRWHFRQAVLTNMKGTGEPIFEHDFPPGSDMAGEIRSGPKAAERMEFELFTRLGGHVDTF